MARLVLKYPSLLCKAEILPLRKGLPPVLSELTELKVCAISPISGGNDSRKRHEKRLIFEIGTIHPHGLNERFSFI